MRLKYQKTVRTHWCSECRNEIPQGTRAVYYAYGGNVAHKQCLPQIIEKLSEYTREINEIE